MDGKWRKSYDEWRDGFLIRSIEKAYRGLKRGRYFIWNINDVKIRSINYPLVLDSINAAEEVGFKYVQTKKMLMAKRPGHYKIKWGPVLVFFKE